MVTATQSSFESRFGHHPCDRDTYKKLKFLHGLYYKCLSQKATWERWYRKAPHNRVMRKRLRNSAGQTVGYAAPVPMPEPSLSPVFLKKGTEKCFVNREGKYVKDGFDKEIVQWTALVQFPKAPEFIFDLVVADYHNARMPRPDADSVKPLKLSLEKINELYEQAK